MTDDRRFYVYAFFRKDGTPYYIGKGQGRRVHEIAGRASRLPPKNRRKILVNGLTEPEAFEYEIALIHCLGRKDLGTGCLRNKSDGGEGPSGWKQNPETIAKRSQSLKGQTRTPEQRERFSVAQRSRNYAATPETREKLRTAHLGKPKSPEHRAKIAAARTGKKLSPEHRAKLSAAKQNPEARAKASAAAKAQHAARRAAAPGQLALNV